MGKYISVLSRAKKITDFEIYDICGKNLDFFFFLHFHKRSKITLECKKLLLINIKILQKLFSHYQEKER